MSAGHVTPSEEDGCSCDIAYFVVRVGGWDGVALQVERWLDVLLSMGKSVTVVTGEVNEGPGPMNVPPFDRCRVCVVPEFHLDRQKELYYASFADQYDRSKWLDQFLEEKRQLKRAFHKIVRHANIVFLHNFSIKHLIPAAWAAMYEIMCEEKTKTFISIDADSPYERSYLMEKFSSDVLRILSRPKHWYKRTKARIMETLANVKRMEYRALPGPDILPNLYHIVLNSYQRKVCHNIYGIDEAHLHAIPDLGHFPKTRRKDEAPKDMKDFFAYLTRHQETGVQEQLDKDAVYIISPVRPIRRKKLREIAYITKLYEQFLRTRMDKNKRCVMVVTHPNGDSEEGPYFTRFKQFAEQIGLTFVHLGDDLRLRKKKAEKGFTYDGVMKRLSYCDSVCIVGSELGGWENGILEATQYRIPVCVNPLLPAFQDMSALGYNYIAAPIMIFSDLKKSEFSTQFLHFPSIETFYNKIYERMFDKDTRKRNVDHNYRVGSRTQSVYVAAPVIKSILRSHLSHKD